VTDTQACQVLLDRLLSGVSVKATEVYKCLSVEDETLLKQQLEDIREQRKWFNGAKSELSEYTTRIRNADLIYYRAEDIRTTAAARHAKRAMFGRKTSLGREHKLYAKATGLYEDALERLAEITEKRTDLLSILDRHFDFHAATGDETFSADAESVPRVSFSIPTYHEMKTNFLRQVVSRVDASSHNSSEAQSFDKNKLKALTKKLKG
jgi:hypothetical protein